MVFFVNYDLVHSAPYEESSQKFLSLRVPSHDGNSTVFTANLAALSLELSFKQTVTGFKGLEVRQ